MSKISLESQIVCANIFNKVMLKDLEKQKKIKEYDFSVNFLSEVNFKKVADDLSYQDPLRIVKFKKKTFAVIHHTIQDKFFHSELSLTSICDYVLEESIEIDNDKDIKTIIDSIRKIKRAKWKKSPYSKRKKINVKVSIINIDF